MLLSVNKNKNKWQLTSVQNSQPHCVSFVNLSGWTSARHNLQVEIGAGPSIVIISAIASVAVVEPHGIIDVCVADRGNDDLSAPLVEPIGIKPPWAKFNEYLEPFAANDNRLEQREHVAIDGLCRNRFNGLIGSKFPDDRDSANTV